jgi:two-component system CheB/CheR fusion protein
MQVSPTHPSADPLLAAYWMPPTLRTPGGMNVPDARAAEKQGEGRPRALVVDDAPDVTEMIAMFLQHAGYDAVMTFSAAEALEAAKSERFEVIVSDIGMPGMNGYDLAVALRSLPGYRDVPLIAVTGFSMYDDRGRALASGFNAHLTKPINPMTLLDLIKSLRD